MYQDLATSTSVVCPEEFNFLMNVYPESDQNYFMQLQVCNVHTCYFNFDNVPNQEFYFNFILAHSTLAFCTIENPIVQDLDAILSNFFVNIPANTSIQYTITFLISNPIQLNIYKNNSTSLVFSNYSLSLPEQNVPLIKLFPNPTSDYFQWHSPDKVDAVQILDLSGKVIYEVQNPENKVNVPHLNSGVYFVRMVFGENSTIQKIIKK